MNPEPNNPSSYLKSIFLLTMDPKKEHLKEWFFNVYTAIIHEKYFYYTPVLSIISVISSEMKSDGAIVCEDY